MSKPAKGGNNADKIGVKVYADTTGFAEELRAFVDRLQAQTELQIRLHLDTTGLVEEARAAAAAARAEAEANSSNTSATPASNESAKQRERETSEEKIAREQAKAQAAAEKAQKDRERAEEKIAREQEKARAAAEKAQKDRERAEEKIAREQEKARAAAEKAQKDRERSEAKIAADAAKANAADPVNAAYRNKILADARAIAKEGESVNVGVDGDKMREELRAKLAEAIAAVHGVIPVGADGAELRAKIDAIMAEARGLTAKVDVDADTAGATEHLDEFTHQHRTATVDVDAKTSGASANIGAMLGKIDIAGIAGTSAKITAISIAAVAATSDVLALAGSIASIGGVAGILPAALGSLVAIGATLATVVHGVGTALSTATQAKNQTPTTDPRLEAMQVQNAQQAIADAETSAADATVKSAKDIALAKRNLQDAYTTSADANYQAAKASTAAENALDLAQRNATDAQVALNKARQDAVTYLRDLNSQLRGANVSEQQAAFAYKNAVDAYNQAQTDPSKSTGALAALKLEMDKTGVALDDAKNKVSDLSKTKAKADAQGVNGLDSVKKAERDLSDAQAAAQQAAINKRDTDAAAVKQQLAGQRQIADATQAVSDSITAGQRQQRQSTEAIAKAEQALTQIEIQRQDANDKAGKTAQQAMDKLAPSAQGVVATLLAVQGRLTDIRKDTQEKFFDGMTTPLHEAVDTLLPQLKTGMGSVASALGGGVRTLLESLKTSLGGGVLDGMFQNTALAISKANGAIAPIVQALSTLGSVGATFLPQLAQGFADASARFGAFIQKAAADGSLKQWIQGGLDAAKQLGSVIGSAFSILKSVTDIATQSGGTTLDTLAAGLSTIAGIVKQEPFKSTLRTIFEGAHEAIKGLMSGMAPLGQMFVTMAPTLKTVMGLFGQALGTALGGISKALSDPAMQKGLTDLFSGLLSGVQALAPHLPALAKALGSVLSVAGEILRAIGPALGQLLESLGPVVVQLAQAIMPLVQALGPFLVQAIKMAMPQLLTVLGVVMKAIPIVTGLVDLVTGLMTGDWSKAWNGVKEIFQGIVDTVGGLLNFVPNLFNETRKAMGLAPVDFQKILGDIGKRFGDFFAGVAKGLGEIPGGIAKAFSGLPGMLGNIFGGLGKFFGDAGGALMKFFSDGIRNSASEVGKSIGQVMDWVKGFFPHSPALRGPLSGSGWTEIGSAGTAIATSFAGGLSGGTGLVGSASDTLMRAVAMPKVNNYRLGGATGAASPLAPTSITNNNTVYEAVSARATAIEMVRLQAVGV